MKAQECHNSGQCMSIWMGTEKESNLKWIIEQSLNNWFVQLHQQHKK